MKKLPFKQFASIYLITIVLTILCILGCSIAFGQTNKDINTYYVEHKYRDTTIVELTTCNDNVINLLCSASIIDSNNVHVYSVRDIFTKEDVLWYEFMFPIDNKVAVASCVIDLDIDELISYPVNHRFRKFKKN